MRQLQGYDDMIQAKRALANKKFLKLESLVKTSCKMNTFLFSFKCFI